MYPIGDVFGCVAIGLCPGGAAHAGRRLLFWGSLGVRKKLALTVILPAALGGSLSCGGAAYLFGGS